MPQLIKGAKHTFGWSRVGEAGRITIPPQAVDEYGLEESEKLILVPGSRTSGGFGLASREALRGSPLEIVANLGLELGEFRVPEGEVIEYEGKPYCWAELRDDGIVVPPGTLERYNVRTGDELLVIRGSGLAIGFAVRGRIVEEARKHPELEVFEPET
jgi:bifunctional DNA-binding transcriptional regulator/antitoxin component of YhaV-PrlF toxin-antitoxin module